MMSTCLCAKNATFFYEFETNFGPDTSDDNNVTEFPFVVDQHRSDAFGEKTSGDE